MVDDGYGAVDVLRERGGIVRYRIGASLLIMVASVSPCAGAAHAAAVSGTTQFRFVSSPGDPIGGGGAATITPANANFAMSGNIGAGVRVSITGPSVFWNIYIWPASGTWLLPGVYTSAPTHGLPSPSSINVGNLGTCSQTFGSFTINSIGFSSYGAPVELDADFVQHCNSASTPPLVGSIKFQAPSSTAVVIDPVTQAPVAGEPVLLAAKVARNGSAPTGTLTFFDGATSLGTAKVGAGGIGTLELLSLAPGSHAITARYSGDARHAAATSSPSSVNVASNATSLWVMSAQGDPSANGLLASYTMPPDSIRIYGTTAKLMVDIGSSGGRWSVNLGAQYGHTLAPGTYTSAQANPPIGQPYLSVTGRIGCNQTYGAFVISAITGAPDGTVTSLAASFIQHCEDPAAPPLLGVVHFNS